MTPGSDSHDGDDSGGEDAGEWVVVPAVVEGVTETGVRTEMVALLPQRTMLSGGDRDHGSGTGDGRGDVSEGDTLGASMSG